MQRIITEMKKGWKKHVDKLFAVYNHVVGRVVSLLVHLSVYQDQHRTTMNKEIGEKFVLDVFLKLGASLFWISVVMHLIVIDLFV